MIRCIWCYRWNRTESLTCYYCGRSLHGEAPPAVHAQAPVPAERRGGLWRAGGLGCLSLLVLLVVMVFQVLGPSLSRDRGELAAASERFGAIENPPSPPAATVTVPAVATAEPTPAATATALPPTPAPPSPTIAVPDASVNTDRLNLRAGPSRQDRVLGSYPFGTPLEVLGKDAADPVWYYVVTPDGKRGWMLAVYVRMNYNPDSLLVFQGHTVIATPTPTPVPPGNPIEWAQRATVNLFFWGLDGAISLGSGTIVSEDGLILTARHVVRDLESESQELYNPAGSFRVAMTVDLRVLPEERFQAIFVAEDPNYDLALLRIVAYPDGSPVPPALRLPAISLGDSSNVDPGDEVTVVGYPDTGLGTMTLTRGAVSGYYGDFIKTDAELSGGNSGGAAVNAAGELIGVPVVVWKGSVGELGYLAPSNAARTLIARSAR